MDFVRINYSYVYIVLWMLYYLQEILMLRGVIAQLIFVLLMLMSFYAVFDLHANYKLSPYIKWLDIMLVVLTIYGLVPIIGGWTLFNNGFRIVETWISYTYLQRIYISILPIYAFYYFFLKRNMSFNKLNYIFVAFLVFCIISFGQNYTAVSERFGSEEITNNAGFFFIPLIPMLHLLKMNDILKFLLAIVIMAFLLLSMKRGAVLAGVIMLVLFIIHQIKKASLKQLSYVFFLSVGAFWAVYRFAIEQYAESSYFQKRVEQTLSGDSSGRSWIYENYWNYFVGRTSPLEFLIGNGANATKVLLGQYAHNDWLEFAINQGVLGLVLYLVYWLVFVWEWKNYRGHLEYKWVLGDLIIAYFLMSLYSMSFDGMPFVATFCIGYCLAQNSKIRTLIHHENSHIISRLSR